MKRSGIRTMRKDYLAFFSLSIDADYLMGTTRVTAHRRIPGCDRCIRICCIRVKINSEKERRTFDESDLTILLLPCPITSRLVTEIQRGKKCKYRGRYWTSHFIE